MGIWGHNKGILGSEMGISGVRNGDLGWDVRGWGGIWGI